MKAVIKLISQITICNFIIFSSIAGKSETVINDNITQTFYFKNIAIHNVDNIASGREEYKVIIQEIDQTNQPLENKLPANNPILGKILWTITSDQLPMTERACFKADARFCSEYGPFDPSIPAKYNPVCTSICLSYGPHYLIFDEKKGVLYIQTPIGSGGSAGWPTMIFAANIYTKEIKRLDIGWDPAAVALSPLGTYLIVYNNVIEVINTINGEKYYLEEPKVTKVGKLQMVYVDHFDLKWLNEHTLQFTKTERLDKFSLEHPTYVVTKVLDIKTRTARIVN